MIFDEEVDIVKKSDGTKSSIGGKKSKSKPII